VSHRESDRSSGKCAAVVNNLDEIARREALSLERLEDEEAMKAPLDAADRHRLGREMHRHEER
jgi:hypothetical protein